MPGEFPHAGRRQAWIALSAMALMASFMLFLNLHVSAEWHPVSGFPFIYILYSDVFMNGERLVCHYWWAYPLNIIIAAASILSAGIAGAGLAVPRQADGDANAAETMAFREYKFKLAYAFSILLCLWIAGIFFLERAAYFFRYAFTAISGCKVDVGAVEFLLRLQELAYLPSYICSMLALACACIAVHRIMPRNVHENSRASYFVLIVFAVLFLYGDLGLRIKDRLVFFWMLPQTQDFGMIVVGAICFYGVQILSFLPAIWIASVIMEKSRMARPYHVFSGILAVAYITGSLAYWLFCPVPCGLFERYLPLGAAGDLFAVAVIVLAGIVSLRANIALECFKSRNH